MLNLRIWIHSVETEITNYDIEFLPSLGNSKYPYAGILITFDLLSDYWDIDEEEISLWCKLICRYPNEQRKFYWKFSEAILGDRSAIDFTLRFKEGTSGKDVDYIQYFTGSNVNVERPIPLNDKITFHSNGNYFPESGIYFHW